ncbi:hypothetical protein PFICI_11224 [Pestalotiopsis fici W106-1]|uniref:NACHT-NTPase and P-loop NTPases N-terminal domain-containing protein n=1 Tax=Pestalotiopsis fici (strain W106-1 / CGMCC3.15140) TaxID=1229662 RepID=W3WU20_PESFW|nr:uncharacterized protein PFICI_11224 [Pestalotiopsis fici W106-1]ETS77350.1 hypothetical protein PFICI_11224 [Pestalotiopsis fici W106-1]
MAGPQATQFLSLAKRTVQNLENTAEEYDLMNLENLPIAFLEVGKDDSIYEDAIPLVGECKAKADRLEQLFSRVVPSPPIQRLEVYRGTVRELGRGNRVETLLKSIMEDIKVLLLFDKDMKSALENQVQALVEAIQKVAAIPPSLPDETEGSSINNYGTGFHNVNTGTGPQNNNNASGQQFIGGTFSGFNPSSPPSKSDENKSREHN